VLQAPSLFAATLSPAHKLAPPAQTAARQKSIPTGSTHHARRQPTRSNLRTTEPTCSSSKYTKPWLYNTNNQPHYASENAQAASHLHTIGQPAGRPFQITPLQTTQGISLRQTKHTGWTVGKGGSGAKQNATVQHSTEANGHLQTQDPLQNQTLRGVPLQQILTTLLSPLNSPRTTTGLTTPPRRALFGGPPPCWLSLCAQLGLTENTPPKAETTADTRIMRQACLTQSSATPSNPPPCTEHLTPRAAEPTPKLRFNKAARTPCTDAQHRPKHACAWGTECCGLPPSPQHPTPSTPAALGCHDNQPAPHCCTSQISNVPSSFCRMQQENNRQACRKRNNPPRQKQPKGHSARKPSANKVTQALHWHSTTTVLQREGS
jgi:hypothetical protein